jgi:two-component system, response regulator PdtaR
MNPQSSHHENQVQGPAGAVRAGRRVLVVEDEFFLAVQIEEWLNAAGFEVVDVVYTAEDAVGVAAAERPGLVIMDIRLAQDGDGIAAAVDILERTGIRCIFASAFADPPTRQRGEAARPFGWLHKPLTGEALLKSVQAAFDAIER